MEIINIGNSPNDGRGDSIRNAFEKVNSNFEEISNILNMNLKNVPSNLGLLEAFKIINHNFIKINRKQKLKRLKNE